MTHYPTIEEAMEAHGLMAPHPVIADGKIHRFHAGSKSKSNKNGYYRSFGSYGVFGDWSQDLHIKWSADHTVSSGRQYERTQNGLSEKQKQAEEHRRNALNAEQYLNSLPTVGYSSYLDRKGIEAFGVRFERRGEIVIPLRDALGKIWSYQLITSRFKQFMAGGKIRGCFHIIGDINASAQLYIAEGYATAASVHMATGEAVIVAFNAGNLEPVIANIRSYSQALPITIAADNDQWKKRNIGVEKAYEAAKKHNCKVAIPSFLNHDGQPTDFNDLHHREGLTRVAKQCGGHYDK